MRLEMFTAMLILREYIKYGAVLCICKFQCRTDSTRNFVVSTDHPVD